MRHAPLHLKKIQKMNRHLLGKNLRFLTKLKLFLANRNDNLKNRCHSKIILGYAIFQLLSESTFSFKLHLLLDNSIS